MLKTEANGLKEVEASPGRMSAETDGMDPPIGGWLRNWVCRGKR